MRKMKVLGKQAGRQSQRMRSMLAILALFLCTSICYGNGNITIDKRVPAPLSGPKPSFFRSKTEGARSEVPDIAGNGDPENFGHAYSSSWWRVKAPWGDPNNNILNIKEGADLHNVYGACFSSTSVRRGFSGIISMTNNKVNVTGGNFNGGNIAGVWSSEGVAANVNNNIVEIKGGTNIGNVYGGCACTGTVSSNKVTIENVEISSNVYGGYVVTSGDAIGNTVDITSKSVSKTGATDGVFGGWVNDGNAKENTVKLTNVRVSSCVYGGYICLNGTATKNTVNLTSVTVGQDVYGARIEKDGYANSNTVNLNDVDVTRDVYGAWIRDGLASSNEVVIKNQRVGRDVCGGHVDNNGIASENTVTIDGGKIERNVFGGFVRRRGKAINNTINIIGPPSFSSATILCGGVCADTATNDAFTGNKLNIETKGVEVKGISNFAEYNFCLKDIKPGDTVLTVTSGGCSWDTFADDCTTGACVVDLSSSIIRLNTKGAIDKGSYTLIHSPEGFSETYKSSECESGVGSGGGLVEYTWDLTLTQADLIATLDKRIREKGVAKALSEGHGAGMACINQGMDYILGKIEETESVLGEREGETGVFYGVAANKSKYNTGSNTHVDMSGISMMGGIGKVAEVGEDELTVGAFMEYGTGDSEIHCKKESQGTSKYVGGGLLGRYDLYDLYDSELSGTKIYGETVLRGGQVSNSFKGKDVKDSSGKEIEYDMNVMYFGAEAGGGCKYKASEKLEMDWSLRYMFGYQGGKDGKPVDTDENEVNFESVISNRIRAGVRGKYIGPENVKPYVGIGGERELSGKVKAAMKNGSDIVDDIPAPSFGGWTGIGEVGARGKVWKFEVDISAQGYIGVREGFGGTLKIKYAFGKNVSKKKKQLGSKLDLLD